MAEERRKPPGPGDRPDGKEKAAATADRRRGEQRGEQRAGGSVGGSVGGSQGGSQLRALGSGHDAA